jgi:hypothetical protein
MTMLFVELQTCRASFALGDCGLFHRYQFLLCFWNITVNQTFVTCYDPRGKSWALISLLS